MTKTNFFTDHEEFVRDQYVPKDALAVPSWPATPGARVRKCIEVSDTHLTIIDCPVPALIGAKYRTQHDALRAVISRVGRFAPAWVELRNEVNGAIQHHWRGTL